MVESHTNENHQELSPENPLSFLEFIEKFTKWLSNVVQPNLNTNSVRVLDDEPLINILLYTMEYIEIELIRNQDKDATKLKRQAEHVTEMVKLLLRKDSSNEILQNTIGLLIEALRDFENLNCVLINDNFVRIQELGKLDLSRITNIISQDD
jgi:hypothetical protein